MRITIHRGNQIGGCITEIVSSMGTRIFVDLGHNLPKGDEESEDEFASEEAIADLIGDARGIFYTHMHGDHVELFQYVPDMSIFSSPRVPTWTITANPCVPSRP